MKSPTVAVEVRWRRIGEDADAWQVRRFLPGAKAEIRAIERADEFEVEACAIGVGDLRSKWVAANVTVPPTHRTGPLALPTNVVGNQSSMWNIGTSVTYAAVSPTSGDSEATISVSAASLIVGSRTINYAASSATITGAPGTSKRVYLYYDDFNFRGGSRPLGVADNIVAAANADGRIALTSLLLNFPEPGGSGGGGGDAGGGGGGAGPRDPGESELPV